MKPYRPFQTSSASDAALALALPKISLSLLIVFAILWLAVPLKLSLADGLPDYYGRNGSEPGPIPEDGMVNPVLPNGGDGSSDGARIRNGLPPAQTGSAMTEERQVGAATSGVDLRAAEQAPLLGQASGERLATAVGHYARSRSMLIQAVREFDKGLKMANASPLLDVDKWRNSLIDRAEELERVLDPQPRSSKSGVKFDADPRLLGGQ